MVGDGGGEFQAVRTVVGKAGRFEELCLGAAGGEGARKQEMAAMLAEEARVRPSGSAALGSPDVTTVGPAFPGWDKNL